MAPNTCPNPCWLRAVQVQILWQDGFNQVAAFELLDSLPVLDQEQLTQRLRPKLSDASSTGIASLSLTRTLD